MLMSCLRAFPRAVRVFFCVAALFAVTSQSITHAGVITQLGFAIDKSGSISDANFSLIKTGLHNALTNLVPTNGMYEITAVFFGRDVTTVVTPTLINSMTDLDAVADAILGYNRANTGATFLTSAITTLTGLMQNSPNHDPLGKQVMNITTDGSPTGSGQTQGTAAAAADAALAGIIDEISVEAVESTVATRTFLRDQIAGIAPGPAGNGPGILQPGDTLTPGFVLQVNSFSDYEAAIAQKVAFVVGDPVVPEPSSLAIFGLIGIVAIGSRSRVAKR